MNRSQKIITKYDGIITNCDGQLLQITTAFLLQCAMIITDCDSTFATVLHDICRPYVLQMGRNELKYGFYRQIPDCFVEYIFQFFINKALLAFKQRPPRQFHGQKMFNVINLTPRFIDKCRGE